MGVLNMLEATRLYAGDDIGEVRFYQASSSEMFGKVQEVPAARVDAAVAALAVRRGQGLRPLHDDQLPRVLRHARLVAGSCSTTSRRAAGPEFVTRKVTRAVARITLGCRRRSRWATSTPSATGASPATTSRRCGGCCSRTRPTTTSSPPARPTRSASCSTSPSRTSASTTGRAYVRAGPALHAPGRGRPADRRRRPRRASGWAGSRRSASSELVEMMVDADLAEQRALAGPVSMAAALVTGVTGQDGGYLAEQLLAEGIEVHGARPHAPTPAGATCAPRGVALHAGDLADAAGAGALRRRGRAGRGLQPRPASASVALSWEDPVAAPAQVNGAAGRSRCWRRRWQLQERRGRPVRVRAGIQRRDLRRRRTRRRRTSPRPCARSTPTAPPRRTRTSWSASTARRGLHAVELRSCTTTSRRGGPPTFVTRKITAAVAAIARGPAGRARARQPRRAPRLGLGAGLRRRHGAGGAGRRRRTTTSSPPASAHCVADFVATAFARGGIADWEPTFSSTRPSCAPPTPPSWSATPTKARAQLGWAPTVTFDEIVGRMVDADLALLDG